MDIELRFFMKKQKRKKMKKSENHIYLYVIFSSNFLHAVTFLPVLHLDVIIAIHKEILVFTFSFNLNLSSKDIKVENMQKSNCMQKIE